MKDIRYLLRSMRRSPGHAAAIILTLALGIGATTAIISVVDYVLLRHLPFADADRLVMMAETDGKGGFRVPSNPTAVDWWRDPAAAQVFEGITYVRGDGAELCAAENCRSIGSAFVKPDFFPLLQPRVQMGRLLLPDDDGAVVISNRLWRSQLGSDPNVIGRKILVDSVPKSIVGVLAAGAVYPPFADVWQPIAMYRSPEILQRRGFHADSRTLGRLRPGVDSAQAARAMAVGSARLAQQYPDEQRGWTASSITLHQELLGNVRQMLLTFAAAGALILVLVCANVAGLLITRGIGRRRELAIRVAIGAAPGRIARQLLSESAGYAIVGGALGAILAAVGVTVARRALVGQLPAVADLTLNARMLGLALAATVLCALACGVFPAIAALRRASGNTLASVGSAQSMTPTSSRARQGLVALQFAMALVLLVGAGLLTHSLVRAADVDIGFDAKGLYAMRIVPPGRQDASQRAALYRRLTEAMRAVPGVRDAAFINHAPFNTASITTTMVVDGSLAADSTDQLFYRTVSSNYPGVMRMTMREGRWFDEAEQRAGAAVFVVNETAARQYWAQSSPVGARVRVARANQAASDFGTFVSGTVVGVVRDVHQASQDVAPVAEVYVPYTMEPWGWGMLMVRADASALPRMREAVRNVDTRLVAESNKTPFNHLDDAVTRRLEPRLFAIRLIGAFALTGIALACLGLYGVMAYNVTQRTREFAVRKAMGATNGRVIRLVLGNSAAIVVAGGVLGGIGAWGGARWISGLLFETSALDPLVYAAAIAGLTLIATLASVLPAIRASKLDPALALRQE